MEKIPNGKYTKELREEAVKLVTVKGHFIEDAAQRKVLKFSELLMLLESIHLNNYITLITNRFERDYASTNPIIHFKFLTISHIFSFKHISRNNKTSL